MRRESLFDFRRVKPTLKTGRFRLAVSALAQFAVVNPELAGPVGKILEQVLRDVMVGARDVLHDLATK